jgi:hypothetical protein
LAFESAEVEIYAPSMDDPARTIRTTIADQRVTIKDSAGQTSSMAQDRFFRLRAP